MRSGLRTAVLLCLAGAFLVLVGAGRTWVSVEVLAGPLADARTQSRTGTELVPGLPALGLVGLAGVVALAATRGTGRVLVGLVLLAVGAGVVAAVVTDDLTFAVDAAGAEVSDVVETTAWSTVTVAGGVLLAGAGLLTTVRGRSWAALGQRYEAPAATAPADEPSDVSEKGLWEALDRGEDPTASLGTQPGPQRHGPQRPGRPADREADRT